ncbi:MAG: hypothetical protein LUI02_05885 [Clostridiales bacterium]|nr:hypothetical protein [Clostridiales bacterium]
MLRRFIREASGFLHITLIISLIIPLIFVLFSEPGMAQQRALFWMGLLIMVPVACSGVAIKKLRHLWVFIPCMLAVLAATCAVYYALAYALYGIRTALYASTTMFCIEGILVLIERIRARAVRIKEDKDKAADRVFVPAESGILETPIFGMCAYFVIIYVIGILFGSRPLCNESLVCGLIYLLDTMLNRYVVQTEAYLASNRRLKNLPSRRVYAIGIRMTAIFMLVMLLAAVPTLLTAGFRRYTNAREWFFGSQVTFEREEEDDYAFYDALESTIVEMDEYYKDWDTPSPPAWIRKVLYAFIACVIVLVIVCVILAIRSIVRGFADNYGENEDIIEDLSDADEVVEKLVAEDDDKGLSERERIRKKYRKTIKKHRKSRPLPYESPREIEEIAGLSGDEEMEELHAAYEQARYDKM